MTATEQLQRRSIEAENQAFECAKVIFVKLHFDPDAVRRFRDALYEIIPLWEMKDQARPPAAPTRPANVSPFRVIEGGRPPVGEPRLGGAR